MRSSRTFRLGPTLVAVTVVVLGLGVGLAADAAGGERTGAQAPGSRLTLTSSSTSALPKISSRAAATWCGTPSEIDSRPNALAGSPVHWIYAIPSDGQDRFSTFASAMQTDWEVIDAWWRGQDSTRAPRSDLAQFSCGAQLDLSTIRLPQSADQLAAPQTPFDLVVDGLVAEGFTSGHSRYVVYYDGPVGDEDICGVAASIPSFTGVAMLQTRACTGVDRAEVVAHELLHAMGAVPAGAPHECPPPNHAHTCDDDRDLMYPFTDGTPLTGLTLDPGRDDYYGHSGAWPDLQDAPWLVQLDRQVPLSLTISGPGRVEADVPGLDCAQSCTTTWNAGTQVTLTPIPNAGAKIVRWSGPCRGASGCAVTVGESQPATVLFAPATYRLNVRVSGKGTVRSSSVGIACPGRCAAALASHSQLRLRAAAAKGWKLVSWTGACRGQRAVCTLPMSGNTSVRAVFARR